MKYLKTYLFVLITIILFVFINANLSFFDIINSNIEKVLNIIVILVSTLLGGLILGINNNNSKYIEGIKFGLLIVITFIIFNFIFKNGFTLFKLIMYIATFGVSILGSITSKKIKIKN